MVIILFSLILIDCTFKLCYYVNRGGCMKRSNSFVFALIFAELICVMGGFLLGKIAYQIKSKSDNNSVNVIISNDNYAVYDNFVAVLKNGKVYYSNSNDKHISVYSDSDEVSGFDSFDTTGRVMRIKSFNLSSGVDADIFLILENGSVMRVNDNYNGLETYKELSDYKISDIVSIKRMTGEGYSFDVILKDGSEKVIKK